MRTIVAWLRSLTRSSAATAIADASLKRNALAISATPTYVVRKRTTPPSAPLLAAR